MSKKQQLLNYLDDNLFEPIISAPYASSQLKNSFLYMRDMLQDFSASGILYFVWNTLANKEVELILYNRLTDEGFALCKQTLEYFKQEFSYEWLIS